MMGADFRLVGYGQYQMVADPNDPFGYALV